MLPQKASGKASATHRCHRAARCRTITRTGRMAEISKES